LLSSFIALPGSAQTPQPLQGCDPAALYLARGDYNRALSSLAPVGGKAATTADRENLRGIALLMSNQPAAALATFERALALDHVNHEAGFNHAVCLLRLRRLSDAQKELAAIYATDLTPYRARAAYHHALADDGLGDQKTAVEWLRKALALDPEYDDARLYLGIMQENRHQFEEAGKTYQTYLARHPHSSAAMLGFARSAQRSGFGETAHRYFEKILAEAPGTPEALEAQKYALLWE